MKIIINPKTFYILFAIFGLELLFLNPPPANAQTMSNQDYILRTQGFNAISGVTEGEDVKVRSSTGDLSPITSEGVNFKVVTGFENILSPLSFSISLSSDIVDFGILSPTNPIVRTLDLGVDSGANYGYSVLVFENEALSSVPPSSKTTIPDTTCDKGDCSDQNASEWTNPLTYGFGYRCDNVAGIDCDSSFDSSNFYKHFPDIAAKENPTSIMAGIGSDNRKSRISYKVNVSGNQAQDIYSNITTYIAVPNF